MDEILLGVSKYLSSYLHDDSIIVQEMGIITRPNSTNQYRMLRVKVSIGRWFWQENNYPLGATQESLDKCIRFNCDSIISNYYDSLYMQNNYEVK